MLSNAINEAVSQLCPAYCVKIPNTESEAGVTLQIVRTDFYQKVHDVLEKFPEILTFQRGDRLMLTDADVDDVDDLDAGRATIPEMSALLDPLINKKRHPGREQLN